MQKPDLKPGDLIFPTGEDYVIHMVEEHSAYVGDAHNLYWTPKFFEYSITSGAPYVTVKKEDWEAVAATGCTDKLCDCDMRDLQMYGCKCGGK